MTTFFHFAVGCLLGISLENRIGNIYKKTANKTEHFYESITLLPSNAQVFIEKIVPPIPVLSLMQHIENGFESILEKTIYYFFPKHEGLSGQNMTQEESEFWPSP